MKLNAYYLQDDAINPTTSMLAIVYGHSVTELATKAAQPDLEKLWKMSAAWTNQRDFYHSTLITESSGPVMGSGSEDPVIANCLQAARRTYGNEFLSQTVLLLKLTGGCPPEYRSQAFKKLIDSSQIDLPTQNIIVLPLANPSTAASSSSGPAPMLSDRSAVSSSSSRPAPLPSDPSAVSSSSSGAALMLGNPSAASLSSNRLNRITLALPSEIEFKPMADASFDPNESITLNPQQVTALLEKLLVENGKLQQENASLKTENQQLQQRVAQQNELLTSYLSNLERLNQLEREKLQLNQKQAEEKARHDAQSAQIDALIARKLRERNAHQAATTSQPSAGLTQPPLAPPAPLARQYFGGLSLFPSASTGSLFAPESYSQQPRPRGFGAAPGSSGSQS